MLSRYDRVYMYLGALFLAALVVCNLIVKKFIQTDLFGLGSHVLYPIGQFFFGDDFRDQVFTLSVGILPYPFTFLVTDIISEIYGRQRANQIVRCGFVASVFTVAMVLVANAVSAFEGSPVSDEIFSLVFTDTWRAITASMAAYLVAQLIDIRIFHFWKERTRGKHLWLRNNGSTIVSQFIDTFLVITLLFWGKASVEAMQAMILSGFLFKVLCALFDTPLFYLAVMILKPRLKPEPSSSGST